MNERIKQLAEQARAEVRADWDKGNKIPYPEAHDAFQRDNDQKFAELIIQQCCKEIKHKSIELLDVDFADHYILRLKKYYGVE